MISLLSAQRPDLPARMELWTPLDLFQRHHRLRLGHWIVDTKVGTHAVAVFDRELPAKAEPLNSD
jgi:hypothetical protein